MLIKVNFKNFYYKMMVGILVNLIVLIIIYCILILKDFYLLVSYLIVKMKNKRLFYIFKVLEGLRWYIISKLIVF